MVAAEDADVPPAGDVGDLFDTKQGPGAETLRDLGLQPLMAGFVQGFASVAIPVWRARRKARREAREMAAAGAAASPGELDTILTTGQGDIFIAPQ
jgi:hypothetical protein